MKKTFGSALFFMIGLAVYTNPLFAQTVTSQTGVSSSADSPDEDMDDLLVALGGKPADIDKRLAEAAKHPLGSQENPVRVHEPKGERNYLNRLRCQNVTGANSRAVGVGRDSGL